MKSVQASGLQRLLQPLSLAAATAERFWLGLASEGLQVSLLLRARLDLGLDHAVGTGKLLPGPCQVKFNHARSTPHLAVRTYPTLQAVNAAPRLAARHP